MEPDDIKLGDLKRILIGNVPGEFMVEVFFRTLLVYILLLVAIRFLGKRMSAQLTITEMAVMITLGAIVSAPMQLPDRGILQAALLLVTILFCQRMVTAWGVRNSKVENITQGKVSVLVKDGVIQEKEMSAANISRQQLFKEVRGKGTFQLGMIKRLYLEGSGQFSMVQQKEPKPGLSVLPSDDHAIHHLNKIAPGNLAACCNCGHTQNNKEEQQACDICGEKLWDRAVF